MTPPLRDQQSVSQIAWKAVSHLSHYHELEKFERRDKTNHEVIVNAINAALTAHDEALPGEWKVVDGGIPGEAWVRKPSGLTGPMSRMAAFTLVAAHNSALRLLVDALRKAQRELIQVQPHIPQSCYPGHEKFIDAHLDVAREAIDKSLAALP